VTDKSSPYEASAYDKSPDKDSEYF